jgi:methylamine dehydrogenase accessory protein MauD
MNTTLAICLILEWIVILGLVGAVLALARQIGILYERVAPMGALMMDSGPKVGETAPIFSLTALSGETVLLGHPTAWSTLLFFVSPTCPVCKKLLPIVHLLRNAERGWLRVVFASDGDLHAHRRFANSAAIDGVPYILSPDLGRRFQIGKLPYAVLIGVDGRIRAKGLVNSREQLESLITASELGVASIQEHIANRDLVARNPLSARRRA